MSASVKLDEFLSRCDLSCRIALRVLLAGADHQGRISRDELLTGVQREYRQMREASGVLPLQAADHGEISPLLADSPLGYFEEHTVGRLVDEGIVELEEAAVEESDGEPLDGSWIAAHLTPAARQAWRDLRLQGDGAWLLGRQEEHLAGAPDERSAAASASVLAPEEQSLPPQDAAPEADGARSADLGAKAAPPAYISPEDHSGTAVVEQDGLAQAAPSSAVTDRPEETIPEPAPPRAPASTLKSRGLVKTYRKRRVVNEVDVEVTEGEIVGLLGPNGAGKTTTFYMIVGLIAPDKGRVYLNDKDLTSVPMYRRARRGIGYLAQEPSIFRKLTVEENILAILQMRGIRRREQRDRLERLLDELGIKHLRSTKAYALSGGERRRLEITRALVGEPKFMLLDEPFAGVDPIAVHDIQQIVADLRRRGIGVLISDHNVEQTLDIVDRAYIMYDGRVRVSGTVSELVWNDEVAEIYLGPTLTARMRQRYTHPQ